MYVIQFPKSQSGNQYAVVFTDYLTKWPEVFATKDQTALTIAELFLKKLFVAMVSLVNLFLTMEQPFCPGC